MQVQVDIEFDQLVVVAKSLPKTQWEKLKNEVDNAASTNRSTEDLWDLLLNGPTLTDEQVTIIEENRKMINKWRSR